MINIIYFVDLCKEYSDMGWAVQEQLAHVFKGNIDKCNINALKIIKKFLTNLSETEICLDVDDVLDEINEYLNDKG